MTLDGTSVAKGSHTEPAAAATSAGERDPADGHAEAPAPLDGDDGGNGDSHSRRTLLLVTGLVAVAAGIPLAVALGVLRHPHWYPALDLAQTELRVRDVGTADPPLLGLAGRFFGFGERGSHPGPLSFWALWPFYKLFGGTAWALQAANVALNLVAVGLAVWIGHRRGGPRLAVVVALGMAVLAHAYTAERLTGPWNPYLPMLWWIVFLLAVWSVLCDDVPLLPVAVFAGSFCAQTHIPYLGLVIGLGAVTTGMVGWRLARPARVPGMRRGSIAAWGGGSLVLLLVLWLPPLIEQWTNDLGNLGLLRESFTHPLGDQVSFDTAFDTWLAHLNPAGLLHVDGALGIDQATTGSPLLGVLFLAVWAVSAGLAWRQRRESPSLWRLHVVVALATGLGLFAMSRITSGLWGYLVLWAWGTTLLMLLATMLTLGPRLVALAPAATATWRSRVPVMGLTTAALAVVGVAFTIDAADTRPLNEPDSDKLAQIAPKVAQALQDGELPDGTPVPGNGERGRYLVRWYDNELGTPAEGFGLLLELERQGLDVGGPTTDAAAIVPHRVRQLDEATATVEVVVGETTIDRWREATGAVEIVELDPRTPAERERYNRLVDESDADLRAAGLDDLADAVRGNALGAVFDDRIPDPVRRDLAKLLDIGAPLAVFVAPAPAG